MPARPDGPPIDALPTDAAVEQFWLSHLRAGLILYVGATCLAATYLYLTPDGRNRALEWVMVVVSLVVTGVVIAVPGRAIVRSSWRLMFFVGWSTFTAMFAITVAAVDGGLDSPLALFVFVPIAYASLAYPAAAVAVIGGVAATSVAVAGLASGDTFAQTEIFVGTIAMVALLAATVTRARAAQEALQRRLTDRLVGLATRDGLTGCLNHSAFYEAVERELARVARHPRDVSLLMVDVDDFKSINDTRGHVVGDAVLRRIGAALSAAARSTDVVGRVGGDEFAALLPETDHAQAEIAADRLRRQVAALEGPVRVSVTIGIAHLAEAPAGMSAQGFVAIADAQLYEGKRRSALDRGHQPDR